MFSMSQLPHGTAYPLFVLVLVLDGARNAAFAIKKSSPVAQLAHGRSRFLAELSITITSTAALNTSRRNPENPGDGS
jgi:hypothetical protein